MHARRYPHDDAGFSLIELMVVMAIVAILAALAAPIFIRHMESSRDAAVRSDLASTRTAFVSIVTLGSQTTEQNLRDYGQAISSGTSAFEIYINESALDGGNSDWWCLQETSATGLTFHVEVQPGIHDGSCDLAYYTRPYYVDGEVT